MTGCGSEMLSACQSQKQQFGCDGPAKHVRAVRSTRWPATPGVERSEWVVPNGAWVSSSTARHQLKERVGGGGEGEMNGLSRYVCTTVLLEVDRDCARDLGLFLLYMACAFMSVIFILVCVYVCICVCVCKLKCS